MQQVQSFWKWMEEPMARCHEISVILEAYNFLRDLLIHLIMDLIGG